MLRWIKNKLKSKKEQPQEKTILRGANLDAYHKELLGELSDEFSDGEIYSLMERDGVNSTVTTMVRKGYIEQIKPHVYRKVQTLDKQDDDSVVVSQDAEDKSHDDVVAPKIYNSTYSHLSALSEMPKLFRYKDYSKAYNSIVNRANDSPSLRPLINRGYIAKVGRGLYEKLEANNAGSCEQKYGISVVVKMDRGICTSSMAFISVDGSDKHLDAAVAIVDKEKYNDDGSFTRRYGSIFEPDVYNDIFIVNPDIYVIP